MQNKRLTFTLVNILLILLIVFVFTQLDYIFKPVGKVAKMLLTPFIFTLFFYYALRPIVNYINTNKKFKAFAVALTILLFVISIVLLFKYGASVVTKEFQIKMSNGELINLTDYKKLFGESLGEYIEKFNINEKIFAYFSKVISNITTYFFQFFSSVSSALTQIIIVPFLLFYLLKDDIKFVKGIISITPDKYKHLVKTTLKEMDDSLSNYITSQLTVALVIGIMMFIAYKIIDMPNALFLSTFASVTAVIPFLGPPLGVLPAILLAFTIDLSMVLKIVLAAVIVQQLEENLVTPNIMSNRLKLHPLTVIIIIIISLAVFGLMGAFIAVPLYTSLIIILKNTSKAYNMRKIKHDIEAK